MGEFDIDLTRQVRTAHADAWEVEGRLREPDGGGATRVRGARLMASGIAQAKWNNADVTDADVNLPAVTAWYAARDVPWGMRVPLEISLELGTPLFIKRCVALLPDAFRAGTAEVTVRSVGESEATAFAALDAAAFAGDLAADQAESRAWVGPQFRSPRFRHWIAELERTPAGIATTVRSNGDAGAAAYLTGLRAAPGSARRHVLEALVTAAVAAAFAGGAALVHANPESDEEVSVLAACGAVEVPGFLIRVVRESESVSRF